MIAIGCDHGGYILKSEIIKYLKEKGYELRDFGAEDNETCDYPDIALPVARSIVSGECEKGILICGTGIGMSMAANKVKGIRAACCNDLYSARMTRLHNDANVLCMGGRVIGPGVAIDITDVFLHTYFEGGRHKDRIDQIHKIENGESL